MTQLSLAFAFEVRKKEEPIDKVSVECKLLSKHLVMFSTVLVIIRFLSVAAMKISH